MRRKGGRRRLTPGRGDRPRAPAWLCARGRRGSPRDLWGRSSRRYRRNGQERRKPPVDLRSVPVRRFTVHAISPWLRSDQSRQRLELIELAHDVEGSAGTGEPKCVLLHGGEASWIVEQPVDLEG